LNRAPLPSLGFAILRLLTPARRVVLQLHRPWLRYLRILRQWNVVPYP
jgi:hypothetical protein